MYYELKFKNGEWFAYDYYSKNKKVIIKNVDRNYCIKQAEAMGFRWAGE